MKDVSRLIDKILAVDDLMPSTREDLEDFKRDMAEGELNRDDREYVIALHERLVDGGRMAASRPVLADRDDEADDADDADDAENNEDDGVAPPAAEIDELRQLLAERDARIAELERELAEVRSEGAATESGRDLD
ncbi:MAG: hypothetical protein J4F33_00870 [Alphaproteobacteria bacterium]|nr:hypothetical protein [Alphaproteobacteria bacterium]